MLIPVSSVQKGERRGCSVGITYSWNSDSEHIFGRVSERKREKKRERESEILSARGRDNKIISVGNAYWWNSDSEHMLARERERDTEI